MKLDTSLGVDLDRVAERARHLERLGLDGGMTYETNHDPFLPLVVAAQATERLELQTGIAVAFARSPMTLAVTAHDLQRVARGRFTLGIGSQVKPHIERRFSMPWSHPAPRMREYIAALRAIWRAWDQGEPLRFAGEFYRHTIMTPFFDPGPSGYPPPRIVLAAVGKRMAEVAGEVADGILVHGFTTERYLREVTLPAVRRGAATAGRPLSSVAVVVPPFVVTGADGAEMAEAAARVREQIAFYGSTPAYRPVLELHGWGELATALNELSREGRWAEMPALVGDDVMDAFAVSGEPAAVAAELRRRFGDVADRLQIGSPTDLEAVDRLIPLVEALRAGG